jgi:hypothetical protein
MGAEHSRTSLRRTEMRPRNVAHPNRAKQQPSTRLPQIPHALVASHAAQTCVARLPLCLSAIENMLIKESQDQSFL